MKNISVMNSILHEKQKEVTKDGIPMLNTEIEKVASRKRIAIDEPNTVVKQDPLR